MKCFAGYFGVLKRGFCIRYYKTIRRGSECGKTFWTDDFLHRNRDCDWNADREKCDHYCHSRALPSLWLSYVLSLERKQAREFSRAFLSYSYINRNYALSTFPDLRQEVHTYIFCAPPLAVLTLTDFTLDFHILLDLLWE